MRDPESGKVGFLSPGSTAASRKAHEFRENQRWGLTAKGADRIDVEAGENVVAALMRFFKKRIETDGAGR